jgi:hypothetical protein
VNEHHAAYYAIANTPYELRAVDDPWTNPTIALPTVDKGIEDFAMNHDHTL